MVVWSIVLALSETALEAKMWEEKLFLSLVVWLSWSILLASYKKALELVTG